MKNRLLLQAAIEADKTTSTTVHGGDAGIDEDDDDDDFLFKSQQPQHRQFLNNEVSFKCIFQTELFNQVSNENQLL